jgi:hypothetical protein
VPDPAIQADHCTRKHPSKHRHPGSMIQSIAQF